ncbi:hypothetical protein [Alicyclobacillus kakegawensis]|nr:hypothetical protein [Alicyclobacillus kakegawensis]
MKVSSAIDVIADVPIDDARSVTADYIAAEMKRGNGRTGWTW